MRVSSVTSSASASAAPATGAGSRGAAATAMAGPSAVGGVLATVALTNAAGDPSTPEAPSSTVVVISQAGRDALAADPDGSGSPGQGADAEAEAPDDTAATQRSAAPLTDLARGALGLESAAQAAQGSNPYYSAGRWLAAGATVGGLVALLA